MYHVLIKLVPKTRVAGAAVFGWSRSRFLGPAPAPTPTLNILFLRDPKVILTLIASIPVYIFIFFCTVSEDEDKEQ